MALGRREAELWRDFRNGMRGLKLHILLDRIESPGTSRGIPDVHLTDPEYGDCWIELKVARGNRIMLTPIQAHWLTERANAGSRCRILVHIPKEERLAIYDGEIADALARHGLSMPGLEIDYEGSKTNWKLVRNLLFYDKMGERR